MTEHFEVSGRSGFSRRHFLKFALGAGAALVETQIPIDRIRGKEAISFTLPEKTHEVDTSKIINALYSRVPFGKSDFIPDILNLIQSNRIQLTGKSIQEKIRENYQGTVNPNVEIKFINGLERRYGVFGEFFHSDDGTSSLAVVDADLRPAEAFNIIDHELVHACWGPGELRAHLHNLLDTTFMTGKTPELLKGGNSDSPLLSLLYRFTSWGKWAAKLYPEYSNEFLAGMQLLYEQGDPEEQTLPQAVDFILTQPPEADEAYKSRYLEARKVGGPAYVDHLGANTYRVANLYLQSVNSRVKLPPS